MFGIQGDAYFGNFVNPDNGPYNIQIIEGTEYCNFQKSIPIPEIENGYEWIDLNEDTLNNLSGYELIGTGDLEILDCVPRHWDQNYLIQYDYINQDQVIVTYSIYSVHLQQTKYFHTIIVKRPFIIEEMAEPLILPHGEKTNVSLSPIPVLCSYLDTSQWYEDYDCKGLLNFSAGGGFPDNVTFNVSIVEGGEYGTMFYVDDNREKIKSNNFTNLDEITYYSINFEANGIEPEDTSKVKILITTTDTTIPQAEVNL